MCVGVHGASRGPAWGSLGRPAAEKGIKMMKKTALIYIRVNSKSQTERKQ